MRAGLMYDHGPTHICDEVEALTDVNVNRPEEEKLVVEFFGPPRVTSTYQPPM